MPVKSEIDNNVEASLKAQFESLDDKATNLLSEILFVAEGHKVQSALKDCQIKALNDLAKFYDFKVLSNGNCKNFTLTSKNPPYDKFVLRLDFISDVGFTQKKTSGELNDITALKGEISRKSTPFMDDKGKLRQLVLCPYCAEGSMLDYAKKCQADLQQGISVDEKIIAAASNMATTFSQFQDKGVSFFDGKITNFLANGAISDQKSLKTSVSHDWHTRSFDPPELYIGHIPRLNTEKEYRDKVHAYILGKNLYSLIVGKVTKKHQTKGEKFDFSHSFFSTPTGKSYKRLIEKLVTPSANERLGVKKAIEHLEILSKITNGNNIDFNSLNSDEEKDEHLKGLEKDLVEDPFFQGMPEGKKEFSKQLISRLKALKYKEPDPFMESAISEVYKHLNQPGDNPDILNVILMHVNALEKYKVVQEKLFQKQLEYETNFKTTKNTLYEEKANAINQAIENIPMHKRATFLMSKEAANLINDDSVIDDVLKRHLINEIISKKNDFPNIDFNEIGKIFIANMGIISNQQLCDIHYGLTKGNDSRLIEAFNSHQAGYAFLKSFGENFPEAFKQTQASIDNKRVDECLKVMAARLFEQKKDQLKIYQYSSDDQMIDRYIHEKNQELNTIEPKDLDNFFDKLEKDITALRDISKIQDMIRNKEVKLSKKSKTFCPHAHRKAKTISQAMTSFSIEERIKVLSGMSSENGLDSKLDDALNIQRARYFKTDEASTFTEYKKMKEQLISNRADVKSKASVETPSQKFHPKQ